MQLPDFSAQLHQLCRH